MKISSTFFPKESEFDFWVVSWLGRLHYTPTQFLIEVFLTNCSNKYLPFETYNDQQVLAYVPAGYLCSLTIGTIFYKDGSRIIKSYERSDCEWIEVVINSQLYSKTSNKNKINLDRHSYPFPSNEVLHDFNFYYCFKDENERKGLFIIPNVVFNQGFFFKSDPITNELLNGTFLSAFKWDQVMSSATNKLDIKLEYDDHRLGTQGVRHAIKYFYLDTPNPVIPYNQIHSSVRSVNSNNEDKYLNVHYPINSKIQLRLLGEYFRSANGKTAFLVHQITDLNWLTSPFTINSLSLVPIYRKMIKPDSNPSNDIEEGHINLPDKNFHFLGDSREGGNSQLDILKISEPDPLATKGNDLDVSVVKEEKELKKLKDLYTKKVHEIEGLTTNSNDSNPNFQKANLEIHGGIPLDISRHQYIHNLIKDLSNYHDIEGELYRWSPEKHDFGVKLISVNLLELRYLVYRISHLKKILYLVEPERGDTGLIHSLDFKEIEPPKMIFFLKEIQSSERLMNKAFAISNNLEERFDIKVLRPIKHQIEKFSKKSDGSTSINYVEQSKHAAQKVFDRLSMACQ